MRTGVRASVAAIMPSSPPFGVCECPMAGRRRRSSAHSLQTATRSSSGVMARLIGTAWTGTPSRSANAVSSAPGEATTCTRNPRARMWPTWPERCVASDIGTVVTWTTVADSPTPRPSPRSCGLRETGPGFTRYPPRAGARSFTAGAGRIIVVRRGRGRSEVVELRSAPRAGPRLCVRARALFRREVDLVPVAQGDAGPDRRASNRLAQDDVTQAQLGLVEAEVGPHRDGAREAEVDLEDADPVRRLPELHVDGPPYVERLHHPPAHRLDLGVAHHLGLVGEPGGEAAAEHDLAHIASLGALVDADRVLLVVGEEVLLQHRVGHPAREEGELALRAHREQVPRPGAVPGLHDERERVARQEGGDGRGVGREDGVRHRQIALAEDACRLR